MLWNIMKKELSRIIVYQNSDWLTYVTEKMKQKELKCIMTWQQVIWQRQKIIQLVYILRIKIIKRLLKTMMKPQWMVVKLLQKIQVIYMIKQEKQKKLYHIIKEIQQLYHAKLNWVIFLEEQTTQMRLLYGIKRLLKMMILIQLIHQG